MVLPMLSITEQVKEKIKTNLFSILMEEDGVQVTLWKKPQKIVRKEQMIREVHQLNLKLK